MALPADWPTEQDSQRHPLEHADDFLGALQRLIPRTRRHLVIQAPTLDTELLGSADIGDLIGQFIRQSRFCRVQLLFNDADSALAGSHRLITLARRFPSYITLLQAQPDDRQRAAWLIADALDGGGQSAPAGTRPEALAGAIYRRRRYYWLFK